MHAANMKIILITGATGFIGSNLCRNLLANGERVIALDNNYTGSLENIQDMLNHPNFKFVQADIEKPIVIDEPLDEIYNLACPASPVSYQGAHAINTTLTCILGAVNVLELSLLHNCKVLQASTSEVYGDPELSPQIEEYRGNVNPIGIRSCYDEGKRCAESLFFDYWRHKGARIKVIRIFNTYGPYMNPNDGRVVSNFICQALSGRDITIYGDGSQTRSLCYIDDLIDIMKLVMASDDSMTGPFNTGNPHELTIAQIAKLILQYTNSSSQICYKPLPQDDPKQRCPDISKVKECFGWQPKVSLESGLLQTIEYFKSRVSLFK